MKNKTWKTITLNTDNSTYRVDECFQNENYEIQRLVLGDELEQAEALRLMTGADDGVLYDIHLIAIPDDLEDWHIDNKESVERIETVYFYDANSHAHLCEITPSYALYPIETRAIFKEGVSEATKDAVDFEIMGAQFYDISYMHVYRIEGMIEAGVPHYASGLDAYSRAETSEAEVIESYEEHFRSNSCL